MTKWWALKEKDKKKVSLVNGSHDFSTYLKKDCSTKLVENYKMVW